MRVIDYFDQGARIDPERWFTITDEGNVTYRRAQAQSWQIARGLYARGFQVGDRVGVLGPNASEGLIAMLGLWRAGGAWSPLNPLNALGATIDFMNEVGIKWLFLHSRFAGQVARIRAEVGSLAHVVCLDRPFVGGEAMEDFVAAGADTEVPDWSDPHGASDVMCAAWPTGGTTAASKAVEWTNQVFATLMDIATRHWPAADRPVNLMVAPITHAAGVMAVMLAAQGGTVVIRPGFDAEDALDHVQRHGVTHMFLPPTAYYRMLECQRSRARDTSSLRMMLISAAPVSPDRFAEGVNAFGPCVAQSWGQAEVPFMATYLSPEDVAAAAAGDRPERLRSCGRPTFSCQVQVMDDDGNLLSTGDRGELVVRGRLVTVGYFRRPVETADVRQFGWHHTGDIGYVDDEGYLYIVDRKKDMIITGGFNVYPAEVEAALLAMPQVRDCAVVGIPDDQWGESVCAIVVPTDPSFADAQMIIAAAKAALGSVKAPKTVRFVGELPSTAVGKVDKKVIRAQLAEGRRASKR
ncbi:acyl-CoA synthetase (AMP-forming)/AMP-acid ligase II [Nocardioides sp. BE266]|uniref:AMP-binding protein n=1 Tax=Nocardioides sp. BE266 TaxID=2817725 RepID=UPI0028624E78|nr:AMP-binding protein [Nocardioides sp. BE266]MDR7255067.1 acyl-CoA synthetase (AMP-forming)/AMP-acid ligase II [Nocardioides sp. BE266]